MSQDAERDTGWTSRDSARDSTSGESPALDASEGFKWDQDKLRTDLLPVIPLEAIAKVLTYGAKKYEDRNWEKGFNWSRPYGAALRHLIAWWSGEDLDPESGQSHLAHAACCLLFLLEFEARGTGNDDRPYHG